MSSFVFQWRDAVMTHGPDSATTQHILYVLSRHMNGDGTSCFPSLELLVKESRYSRRTVIEHLGLAEKAGWFRREHIGDDRRRVLYVPLLPVSVGGEDEIGAGDAPIGAADAPFLGQPVQLTARKVQELHPRKNIENKKQYTRMRVDENPQPEADVKDRRWPDLVRAILRAHGMREKFMPQDDRLLLELPEDVRLEDVEAAAIRSNKALDGNPWNWGYLRRALDDVIAARRRRESAERGRGGQQASTAQGKRWWESWDGVIAMGVEHGLSQGDNEPPHAFKQRVIVAVNGTQAAGGEA